MNQNQYKALQVRYNALVDAYQELDHKSKESIRNMTLKPNPTSPNILDLMGEICHLIEEKNLLLECISGDKKTAKSSQHIYKVKKEQWQQILAQSLIKYQPIYLQKKEEKDMEKWMVTLGLLEEGTRGIYFKTTRNSKAIQVVKIKKEAFDLLLLIRGEGGE